MMRWRLPLGLLLGAAALAAAGEEPIEKLEKRMAELVNRDRAQHKLPPLTFRGDLAAVARGHSRDMKEHDFFSHHSKRTGGPKERILKARIPVRASGENIAVAPNVETGEQWLMNSPRHRDNILSTKFTCVGIGLERNDKGWLVITQLFALPPPEYDVEAVRKQIVEGIVKGRTAKSLRRLLEDPELTKQAKAHSQRAARIEKHAPLWLEDRLARDAKRWRIHEVAYFLTDKPDEVSACDVALNRRYGFFGLAVVQAPRDSKAVGALWITLICGQKK